MILRNRNAQKTLRHYEFSQAQSAIALWRGLGWSVWLVFAGIIGLQFLPYTVWRSQFILQPEDAQALTDCWEQKPCSWGFLQCCCGLRNRAIAHQNRKI
ncbi:hypothetical protein PN466_11590 [Roseofilum reptotaenium CS-1145]|uniref:Uncharacterized protein n=1 Tax=Roseofilum reptotaenium AO1-A TaxID=1925591 RepID=A0A1L9QNP8_9CYAN|nr:hypothetical protein [Roseofilum reptotaenium]MDB9517590.1 hypothetical protein [Roseofilum reptotaenium CS-1145]OJJ24279.1 hypothetical protein BI308_17540 [Roseofilum reptotaenium AO1-A]